MNLIGKTIKIEMPESQELILIENGYCDCGAITSNKDNTCCDCRKKIK